MSIALAVSVAALVAAVAGVAFSAVSHAASRRARQAVGQEADFRRVRDHLKACRGPLAAQALRGARRSQSDPDVPLLTAAGWIPRRPLSLGEISLALRPVTVEEAQALDLARSRAQLYWPPDNGGHRLPTYSSSILAFDERTRMEDQPCYRLVAVTASTAGGDGQALGFAPARYFDGIDTAESLAYESALSDLRRRDVLGGSYRQWLGDPFRLDRRAALPGIDTLTVWLSKTGPRFFMHRRGAGAGLSMGVYHVAPAGEFQPQIDDPTIWACDLDILRNLVREYAEEFLGVPEATGHGGATIDFDKEAPYRDFMRAYRSGGMKVYYLGVGLDPLSWKPEILTVCVFDDPTFSKLFMQMVTDKVDEGTGGALLAGNVRTTSGHSVRRYAGIDFTSGNVAMFADTSRTLPSGVACLKLTTRWMQQILP